MNKLFSACHDCIHETSLREIEEYVESARAFVSFKPKIIDVAVKLAVDLEDKYPEQVSHIIDVSADLSSIANSVDIEILDSMIENLALGPCNEGERITSRLRCPKLDLLMPKMVSLVTKIQDR